MATVAILGGGIAGLTAAFRLQRLGHAPTIFEAASRAGGALRTERADGFLVEYGPNTLRARTPLLDEIIDALDLEDLVVEASEAAKNRYIVRDGVMVALPIRPPALVSSNFLSWQGKLRLLREPFIASAPPEAEESVADFVRRRLGKEALDYGANPFVAGIFAGDPEQLSVQHAFPRLVELEQQHGSLLKGLVKSARATRHEKAQRGGVFSFHEGIETLTDALAERVGENLCLGARVAGLQPTAEGWQIQLDSRTVSERFDAVVSTLPLHRFVDLNFDSPIDVAPLSGVYYPPVAVVALGFHRADVGHALDGFGVLVPEAEQAFKILGVIFASSIFPNRAPAGHVLLTALVGGARYPALVNRSDEALYDLVLADLDALLGVEAAPTFARLYRWPHAIPQYTLGYGAVKDTLGALERQHPGLYFAGNYRHGISVADTLASADAVAHRLGDGAKS